MKTICGKTSSIAGLRVHAASVRVVRECPDHPTGAAEITSMRRELLALGLTDAAIRVERHSIDTITNFARAEAEGHFGDDGPVAIVAQESHLARMLEIVAPRTLRRDYLGVVVPEPAAKDVDSKLSRLLNRVVLLNMTYETPDLVEIADRRIARVWKAVNQLGRISRRPWYYTEP